MTTAGVARRVCRPEAAPDLVGLKVESIASEGEVIVVVQGEIDLATAPLLFEKLAEQIPEVTTRLVLDLEEVPFVDSIGLGVLARIFKRLRHGGADLVLRRPSPQVAKVLQVSGLDQVFTVQS